MSLIHSLHVSFVVFLLGLVGIYLNRKNIILVLMSIELMLLGINLNLLSFSVSLDDLLGQIFALFILSGVGLTSLPWLKNDLYLESCSTLFLPG